MTGENIVCWFCPTCKILTLLEHAVNGECTKTPQRQDCPLYCTQQRAALLDLEVK
jgi:hypothetical protein